MKLRQYQEYAKNKLRESLNKHTKVLLAAPTGFGKTVLAKSIIQSVMDNQKSVLFCVPRRKLAVQSQKSFGFGNLILGADTFDNGSLCDIASLQSFYSRKINKKYDLILIDECHYAHGSEYINYIFETYPRTKIIGLSATPLDENGYLLQGYDDIVDVVQVKELIDLGFLTDIELYATQNQPDTNKLKLDNGDYNIQQSSELMCQDEVLSNGLNEWFRLAKTLKTIVFATDINHCRVLTHKFNELGFNAVSVHSEMKEFQIKQAYEDFNKNEAKILVNVDMATFGFDEPSIECMLFLRPIKSLRLYKQMVGRGIRTFEGKAKCLMLDCANVIHDNGLPLDPIIWKKKPIINKIVDKQLGIERETSGQIKTESKKQRVEVLQKVGSLIDLYAEKVYNKEQELVDDCKKILERAGFYSWRQNSGKAYIDGRYVTFTSKNGLPDISLVYKSVYIGLELKLKNGRLTPAQKQTLPEFLDNKVTFFFIENVIDLLEAMDLVMSNIKSEKAIVSFSQDFAIKSEKQQFYRRKYLKCQ